MKTKNNDGMKKEYKAAAVGMATKNYDPFMQGGFFNPVENISHKMASSSPGFRGKNEETI